MIIEKLQWDSEFFGLRVGRVMIASEEEGSVLVNQEAMVRDDYDLVYVFAKHGVNFSISKAKRVDEKVVYSMSDLSCKETSQNVILCKNYRDVFEDLLHLALISGQYSRFRVDNSFPDGSYERLYSRWIEQSVKRNNATEVFCYMIDGVARGMATVDIKNGSGSIGLFAVHENYQHRGIGTAMIQSIVKYLIDNKVERLTVATQRDNVAACKLYERIGFEIDSVTDVWHWWL